MTESALVLERRIKAVLDLHRPTTICLSHGIREHDCDAGDYMYRCSTCAITRARPCATWRLLTGQEKPA